MAQETGKEKSAHDVQEVTAAQDVQQEQNDTAGPEAAKTANFDYFDGLSMVTQMIDTGLERLSKKDREKLEQFRNTPEGILTRVAYIDILKDFMRDPGQAILSLNLPNAGDIYRKYAESLYLKSAQQVAEETGADPLQIIDRDRRTPEQGRALTEVMGRAQLERLETFFNTRYMQAIKAIEEGDIKTKKVTDPDEKRQMLNLTVLYFFARHWPEVRPDSLKPLTAKQKNEIKHILNQFDRFIDKRPPASVKQHFTALLNLPQYEGTIPESIIYPKDKINNAIWNWDSKTWEKLIEEEQEKVEQKRQAEANAEELEKQIIQNAAKSEQQPLEKKLEGYVKKQFNIGAAGKGKNKVSVNFAIMFNELEKDGTLKLTGGLTPFDKRVYIAIAALASQNNGCMSIGQIYATMGHNEKPTAANIEKINDSLNHMDPIKIYIQNNNEHKAHPNVKEVVYDGHLLPFERVSGYMNNGLCCESIIHVFREPPLMTFARERNQITTIPREILATPLRQTDSSLRLEDYLVEQISAMKRDQKYSRKMLYTTIFKHSNANTSDQRKRTRKNITRLLDYYKECKWIKNYSYIKDGVKILP